MDNLESVSEVHGSSADGHAVRVDTSDVDLTPRELRIASLDDAILLLKRYAELSVPRDSGEVFLTHLTQRADAWFVEIGDVGLCYLTHIIPGYSAIFNVVFWDEKLRMPRPLAIRPVLSDAFEQFDLKRISAVVAEHSHVSDIYQKFLKRVGFVQEGTARRGKPEGDDFVDLHLYSLLPEDTESWQ